MKESKLLKRISAATLAASIFAANTSFDCILVVSNAADAEEQLSDDEVTVAQKSDFSTLLYYYIEKNKDGDKFLKVNDVDSFNRFFNAELNSDDAEGADEEKVPFPKEGIFLDEKTENILKITPKFFDENEVPVINPYRLIEEMAEEEASEEGEEAETGETAETAEDPIMAEYNIDLAKVNAAAMTLELSEDEQLSYFIVNNDEGYDVVIPDDYDKLAVAEVNDEAVVLEADGEKITVSLEDAEFNTSITGFAELKTQELKPDDTYSVERFCDDEEMPYYYGEVVKITPAEHCKVLIGDDEYLKPVAVEINGDEVDGQEKRFKINLSGNYADQVEISSANLKDENGERTFKEGDTVTISPRNIPDGYKVTLSGGGKSVQSSDLVIENAHEDINVGVNREDVQYLGFNKSNPAYVMIKVDEREYYPNLFAGGNDHVTISYDNNIKLKNDVVKVKSITVTTADGNSAVVNPEEHTVDNKGLNAYFNGEDEKSFELRKDGIHGDISINVDYEISYNFSFRQFDNSDSSDLIEYVTIKNEDKLYKYQNGVVTDENGNVIELERALEGDNHIVSFYTKNGISITQLEYKNDYTNSKLRENANSIEVNNDMSGNNIFVLTLKNVSYKMSLAIYGDSRNTENIIIKDVKDNWITPSKDNRQFFYQTYSALENQEFTLSVIPKNGYYVKQIEAVDLSMFDEYTTVPSDKETRKMLSDAYEVCFTESCRAEEKIGRMGYLRQKLKRNVP